MTKSIKIFCSVVCLLAVLFIGVGYAAVSGTLNVTGNASYKELPYEGIRITEVTVKPENNVSVTENRIINPTNLSTTFRVNRSNATITLAIEVENTSDITYWYQGYAAMEEVESNDLLDQANGISITTKDLDTPNSSNFDTGDWIPPDTVRVFYATYRFGSNATGTVTTMVNFKFGKRLDSVQDGFMNVLNDAGSYAYLSSMFNEVYAESGKTVLGNVGEHEEIFDTLFGPDLTVNFDGEEKPVTIMIARQNVDKRPSGDSYSGNNGPTGCEYTIYVTVDNLDDPNGQATVYAVSYTCGADGYWYQIGELYEGTSSVQDYDTTDEAYEGAFDVSEWKAVPKSYTVMEGLTYEVATPGAQPEYTGSTIEAIMTAPIQDFRNRTDQIKDKLKTICQTVYDYDRNPNGSYTEVDSRANQSKPGYAALKSAFERLKPHCQINNGAQDVRLQDNITNLYRSELICILEQVQTAYDYYLQVN